MLAKWKMLKKLNELNALCWLASLKRKSVLVSVAHLLKSGSCGALRKGGRTERTEIEARNQLSALDRVDVVLCKRRGGCGCGDNLHEEEGSNCTRPQSSNFNTSSTH